MTEVQRLEKALSSHEKEKADLEKEKAGLLRKQRERQAEASMSLAGVSVGNLLGTARSQEQRRLEADSMRVAIGELDRRIEAKEAEILEVREDLDWARERAMRAEIVELFKEIRELTDLVENRVDRITILRDDYHPLARRLYAGAGSANGGDARYRIIRDLAHVAYAFVRRYRYEFERIVEHRFL